MIRLTIFVVFASPSDWYREQYVFKSEITASVASKKNKTFRRFNFQF